MADTQTAPRINPDARVRYQLAPAAVEQAKRRLKTDDIATLGGKLGYSRQTFWRVRTGQRAVPLSEALAVAKLIGWPLDRAFEQVSRG
ncbi:hypothetical protein ACFYUR_12335 [Micromonospora haikouensis]|uniref:hypothetical protein n=1 Tax=Micromonospora haikouensis TaxID=686309 RepID=UPI0036913310